MSRSKQLQLKFALLIVLSCNSVLRYYSKSSFLALFPEFDSPTLPSIPKEYFSACLLVSDDNFRLAEWIAYHYHVLPLRYLVVASDPNARHSPKPVLDTFQQQLSDMTIMLWNDSDFSFQPSEKDDENGGLKANQLNHVHRQNKFNSECLNHLYLQNGTAWTALWDVDEFIAFNGFNVTRVNSNSNLSATSPAYMSDTGAVLRYLNDYGEVTGLGMHRVFVGNEEIPSLMKESHPVDPRRFDTLRYRFEADFTYDHNGPGKCMGNVQKITHYPVDDGNAHWPSKCICPKLLWPNLESGHRPFYLKHYAGSWEAYSYRDDRRTGTNSHNYDDYLMRSNVSGHLTHGMSQWMPAFMQNVGSAQAAILFQNSGLDEDYNASFKIAAFRKVVE